MTQLWKSALLTLLVGGAVWLAPAAKADEWDKQTVLTFNEPVEIPGKVLPAGTYVLRLLDSQSDRNVVQVFTEDQKQLLDHGFSDTSLPCRADRQDRSDFR